MSGCFSVSSGTSGESLRWQLCMPAVLLGLALFALDEADPGAISQGKIILVNGLRVFLCTNNSKAVYIYTCLSCDSVTAPDLGSSRRWTLGPSLHLRPVVRCRRLCSGSCTRHCKVHRNFQHSLHWTAGVIGISASGLVWWWDSFCGLCWSCWC